MRDVVEDGGTAGRSAGEQYDRLRAAREKRVKDRYGQRLGSVLLAISDEPQSTRAWASGAEGERELAAALADLADVRVLHDRAVPGTRGNIDHVVVAPAGVFVVDAKAHTGEICVRDVGGLFKRDVRLFVGGRDCSALAIGLTWQVAAVERALSADGALPRPPTTPVLCFVHGEWPLVFPPSSFRGVRLEGKRSIKKLLTSEKVLDAERIDQLYHLLATQLRAK
jgi:hypothetical protein